MSVKIGNIELFMGPKELGAPDNLEDAIVHFIDDAKKSLDIAVQELECERIAKAIVQAKKRGCNVKVVLEADYLWERRDKKNPPPDDPWKPEGRGNEGNRRIQNALLRSGVWVRSDFNPAIFHQKFIIRDGSAVLTGSTNFTPTGVKNNLNHVIIIKSRRVAKSYQGEFNEIQEGRFGSQSKEHEKEPRTVTVSGVPIKVLFAPDHSPEMEIMKQMAKGEKSLHFAIFTFAQSSGIDDQMALASRAGLKIRGALDGGQGNQRWAATRILERTDAEIYLVRKRGKLGKLHHKLMVIDEKVIIAGSFNYTGAANYLNDENIIVLGSLDHTDEQVSQEILANYAIKEIDRIIKDHGKKVV